MADDNTHLPNEIEARESSTPSEKESGGAHIEQVRTFEKVEGHPGYYEKDGLRTYGDDQDHDHEPPWTTKRVMSLVAMAFLWTGSQIPAYLLGGIAPLIYSEIGGYDRWVWFVLAYLLSLAAVCPFVGSLSDLIGRRYVALLGSGLLIVAMIIAGTAHNMNQFIAGMGISGVGAGICELTCLAGTSELAPTRKRGLYVAALVLTIIPFCPSALYAWLIAGYSTWRWCAFISGMWALIGAVGVLIFYFPPPRPNSRGLTKKQIIDEIDFFGGFLSITGMIIFLAGLQWGGYQYTWESAHVLVPLILGFLLLFVAFPIWEIKFAKYPMFPSRMKKDAKVLSLTLVITAISGANFFSILMFWPTQAFNVYGHDPVGVGIRTLPIGFSILGGCCIILVFLSLLRGHIRELLMVSSILMTAGCGALAAADLNNIHAVYGILVVAGLGIGGIVVPASIITTIICPDDIIATVTALTLSIRVIGGCIGYTTYYNVFVNKFKVKIVEYVGGVMVGQLGITNETYIVDAITLTGLSLVDQLKLIPGIAGNETAYQMVLTAGQVAYSESYRWVYLVSIAFGGVAIICSAFLGNIEKYMDDHVAVVI
ncbi:uncharacterized protein A1O5_07044 [Cladophialophora psammophila CBS 110553]|uniref:Major facilitator superfamily (MFS) profile domain-containing protein n=1 Tax=Cladophialophora psammophila CBS 110553 TaxID=1182543 RepID=W9WZ76_9EURO|nr:uncharacterized protein A1O5_07044 [Cladophialophora psammophila CBS 110553]EXJ69971.1 hypothetical protein A1O5_07044 [Cladophialophora psammophila CBS 110553]